MPLPHFLLLIAVVLLAAVLTLWLSLSAGVPPAAIVLIALSGVVALHLGQRSHRDPET